MDTDIIVEALESTAQLRHTIRDGAGASLEQIFGGLAALEEILQLFVKHDLFEQFCVRLVLNKRVAHLFLGAQDARVQISVASILEISEDHHPEILKVAMAFLKKQGPRHLLHRERFLIEVLGTHLNQQKKSQTIEVKK
ncbi:hypothetical protein FSARC_14616 [Fusarium sarcochroum]|uniref:Uncharacterized protein n=1 Tax=Fusarium sarcochroum TaxID=1208366 RepID=A0A8H4SS75_9HYPO|nr:hypothetical protein FSARC_14616 [Fusarium sarcochroum]